VLFRSLDLVKILENNTTLTSLTFDTSRFNQAGFKAIAQALVKNKILKTLDISESNINDDVAIVIAEILNLNSNLTELSLSCNSITDDGAKFISEALKFNHTLQKLDLSRNSISDADGSIISTIIKFNSTLKEIKFCDNYIKNESAIAISDALKFNTSLSRLDLSKNLILIQGIKHIADSLLSNQSLTELKLSINIIDSDHFIEPIQEFIKAIENLNIDINHEGKHLFSIENVTRLHYKDNSTINRLAVKLNNIENVEFLKAYLTIQKICNRNRQKEFLVARATPIFQKLAPETPSEIADLLSRELLITESGAETLRRVGDLI
jgi:Ran GTPase-activating protein (RanGAP) involved in mRNA processing and transport